MVQLGHGILLESELSGFAHRTACIHIALIEVAMSVRPSVLMHGTTSRSVEVIGSLLNFCDSTCVVNMFLKNLGVFNLLCVIGDILLLTFWLLLIVVYI